MLRFVPPAGAPLKIGEIFRACWKAQSNEVMGEEFQGRLASQLHAPFAFPVCSGRAALWVILKALRELRPDREVVVIPAYICFSVAAAIVRAGLKIYPVDIDPQTLDFDFSELEALPGEKLLCILMPNLFGIASDSSRINQIARTKDAFLIDDAAQALGASREGRLAGMRGDVGFYSFGRGKVLAAGEGGIVVTHSEEIACLVRAEVRKLPAPSVWHSAGVLMQLLAYSVFLDPSLYRVPDSLPFLKLGITEFRPGFRLALPSGSAQMLQLSLMGRLAEINRIRRDHAQALKRALEGNPVFASPTPATDSEPAYVRFPVIARDQAIRDEAIRLLRRAGIGSSPFYPSAICDIEDIGQHMQPRNYHRPQAEFLAQRLMTLPTHPLVRDSDMIRMAEVLNSLSQVGQRSAQTQKPERETGDGHARA